LEIFQFTRPRAEEEEEEPTPPQLIKNEKY